jgi:hypothetical protein
MTTTANITGSLARAQEPCLQTRPTILNSMSRSLEPNKLRQSQRCAASSASNDNSYKHPRDRKFQGRRNAEDNPCYIREDMSAAHSREARKAFLAAISQGEGAMNLAEAALQIAAEDDALVSHSSVKFPVASFRQRLQRLAEELIRVVIPSLHESNASNQQILDAILDFLYTQQKFTPPNTGRSALLGAAIKVDAPGIWENPRVALLNEVLITKRGIPAALAIVLSDLLRRLLIAGAIDFVARVECTGMSERPTVTLIDGITREMALGNMTTGKDTSIDEESIVLNMCTVDVLAECLSYLKRAYWPFPWDGLTGGFRGAASAFLDGAESAEAEAIARTARHRLERGIWTSPGAGDLRRALAAAERLVILQGDDAPEERRDLAVLYCHAGMLQEAKVELKAYAAAQALNSSSSSSGGGFNSRRGKMPSSILPLKLSISPIGISIASSLEELPDAVLADRMLTLLGQIPMEKVDKTNILKPLDFDEAVRRSNLVGPAKILPLTW